MKTNGFLAIVGLTILMGAAAPRAEAQPYFTGGIEIRAAGDFYNPLAPYGAWMSLAPYGRCWHPVDVESGWRPYENGHWEWTDVGWYWASDEPWAWACYHYGSWTYDPYYGWLWVPGVEWAPAWVTWREGGDYVGWAPCAPPGVMLGATAFVFVDIHHFHDRFGPRSFIVNDPRIFQRTRLSRGFRREIRDFDGVRQRVYVNTGPAVSTVRRATGRRFDPAPVTQVI